MKKKFQLLALILVVMVTSFGVSASSLIQLEKKSQDASNVLEEVMNIAERTIPNDLLQRAVCVATVPDIIRVGFVLGARYGTGLVSCRVPGAGWSQPSFVSIKGGSWGAQIGVASVDLVLVFIRENAIEKFSKNNFTIGVDAAVAVGPVGRDAQAGTDYQLNSEIYSYSRARGIFAGLAIQGTLLSVKNKDNAKIYGPSVSTQDILNISGVKSPVIVMPYVHALTTYAP